jgi:hypothetical protein
MKRTRTASPESSSSRTPSPTPALKQPRPDAESTESAIECSEGLCAERSVRFENHEALRSHYVTAHSFVCRGVVTRRQDGSEAVGEVLGDGNGNAEGEEECGKIFPEERLLELVSTSPVFFILHPDLGDLAYKRKPRSHPPNTTRPRRTDRTSPFPACRGKTGKADQ